MPETTPKGLTGLAFGGDYNPEQWPENVWHEDVRLMREAGVTMVSVGIFSWALLEPARGTHDFGWLDRLLDLLHENGIRADLGTPTVAPPVWFYREHPEALPVAADGTRYEFGSRGAICHSNSDYRAAAASITTALATRYADHPALALWHVHNEYGVPVSACYCASCAAHFRRWLARTYGTVDAVNEAWGTAFWGQRYADFEQINPPRVTPTVGNPAQALDYKRFADETMRENFVAERDILHRLAPGIPVTTNFMTALSQCDSVDYWAWGREVDLVTNDHYLITDGRRTHVNLAMAADLTRSVAGGAPGCCSNTPRPASTGSPATRRSPRARWPATPSRTWRAAPRAPCSSSGGSPGAAPRSSTRRCCRTPAPTPGSGARSPNSARPSSR